MRWLLGLLLAVLVGQPAHAWDWGSWTHQLFNIDWTPALRPYVGGAYSSIHHTGHDRNSRLEAERWINGGKVFAGMELTRRLSVEFAYHHLGQAPLVPSVLAPGANERAYAFAASTVWFTPPIEIWMVPSHRWYARFGAAYKHITEDNRGLVVPAISSEDGFGYLIGGGVEFEFTQNFFARFEYEYLSKIGTSRVINTQHTPLSASLGIKF